MTSLQKINLKKYLLVICFAVLIFVIFLSGYKAANFLKFYHFATQPIIGSFSVVQVPSAPGQPIRWVKTLDINSITESGHLLALPKNASQVKISTTSPGQPSSKLIPDINRQKLSEISRQNSQSKASQVLAKKIEKERATGFWASISRTVFKFDSLFVAVGEATLEDDAQNAEETILIDLAPVVEEATGDEIIPEDNSDSSIAPNPSSSDEGESSEEEIISEPVSDTSSTIEEEIIATTSEEIIPEATPVVENSEILTTGQATTEENNSNSGGGDGGSGSEAEEAEIVKEPVATTTATSTDLVQVEYETPAPVIAEAETDTGKIVSISSTSTEQDVITNVLAFTNIPEIYKVGQEDKIKIKWTNNGDQNVVFQAYDLNNNGRLDYVEWTVPHLSEQIFEIIFISKAFELDQNQEIVNDIYDTVKEKDNNWVEIADDQYIRATFYIVLNETKDITIYAKPINEDSPSQIKVYPVYTDGVGNITEGSVVATFPDIDHEGKYKILLTDLDEPTDTFDLQIVGGSGISFDYIVDPNILLTNGTGGGAWTASTTWALGAPPVFANGETCEVVAGDTIGEVPEGEECTTNYGTITENNGTVTINNSSVTTNNGTVDTSSVTGSVNINNGIVTTNDGVIQEYNNGTVNTNNGTVYFNALTLVTNNGTVDSNDETGTITTNNLTVNTNTGTIETNSALGTVGLNNGDIDINDGTVDDNNGTVTTNNNIVTLNRYLIVTNNGTVDLLPRSDASITTNNSIVTTNNGVIETNSATGVVTTNDETGVIEDNISGGSVPDNYGTLTDGTFIYAVHNYGTGIINGGTFSEAVINDGDINGGTFTGSMTNSSTISGATLNLAGQNVDGYSLYNTGTITDAPAINFTSATGGKILSGSSDTYKLGDVVAGGWGNTGSWAFEDLLYSNSLAVTGSTISVAAVTTTGAQSYTGATTLNGVLSAGGNIDFNSGVTLATGGGKISTTVGDISFDSTFAAGGQLVDLDAPGAITITGDVSNTGHFSAISSSTDIGRVSTSDLGEYDLIIWANTITLRGDLTSPWYVDISGAVTLANDISVTGLGDVTLGGGIKIEGTVDSDSTARSLNLSGGAGTIQIDAVGSHKALSNLTASADMDVYLRHEVTTIGSQSYTAGVNTAIYGTLSAGGNIDFNSAVILFVGGGTIVTTGGDITFDSTLTTSGSQAADLDASGAITITGDASTLTNFSASGTSISVATTTTTGTQNYTGATTLNGDLSADGDITITGGVTLGASQTDTIILSGTGSINCSDKSFYNLTLMSNRPNQSIALNGGVLALGASQTGTTTISGSATINSGAFSFNELVNNGEILGGTLNSAVTNNATISDGTYYKFVTSSGVINDGQFCQTEEATGGTKNGGTYGINNPLCYNYKVAPNAPTIVLPLTGAVTVDNKQTVSVNYRDLDGETGKTYYRISSSSVSDCVNSINIVASGLSAETATSNENTSWTPTSSIGADGAYYWCAQNSDGELASNWTAMGSFILDTTPPILSFTDNVEVGPVTSDTITADWGNSLIKKWEYDADGVCPGVVNSYEKNDTDSISQTTTANNTKYICLYGEDLVGNKTTLVSANDINISSGGGGGGSTPTCTDFTYSWSECVNGKQTVLQVITSEPSGCQNGNPLTEQACVVATTTPPLCTGYTYSTWGECINNQKTRTTLTSIPTDCVGGVTATTTEVCVSEVATTTAPTTATTTATTTPIIATCTSYIYSAWGACLNNLETRTTLAGIPADCVGGVEQINKQACVSDILPPDSVLPPAPEEPVIKINFDNNPAHSASEKIVNNIVAILDINDLITNNISVLGTTTEQVVLGAKKVLESPAGNITAKVITTAGVIGGGVAASSVLVLNGTVVADLLFLPFKLWALLLSFLGLRKKRLPWGTVYDSVTKQPIDPAYVTLKKVGTEEENMSITDLDGRYGFLVTPGRYILTANKTNYLFPSKKLLGKASDVLYGDLYFGEEINITEAGSLISKNIPMDPVKFDWNEFVKGQRKMMKFYSKRDKMIKILTDWIFRIGFVVSLLSLFLVNAPYNLIIFVLYIVLTLLRKFGFKKKTLGSLTDKEGNPLSFAIIRVISSDLETEISSKVVDRTGRYYCLVPKGRYFIKIEKKNDDESYSLIYTSPVFEAENGIVNKNFVI